MTSNEISDHRLTQVLTHEEVLDDRLTQLQELLKLREPHARPQAFCDRAVFVHEVLSMIEELRYHRANLAPCFAGTTPERMREIRERMQLPVRSLGRWANRSEASIRQMEASQRSIPAVFGIWIEELGFWQERHPPPDKSR